MKNFIVLMVVAHLVIYGWTFYDNPTMLFNYFDNWKGDPVLYTLPVLGYLCVMGLFISFFGLIEEVFEINERVDEVTKGKK